jgi:hypothetical protein
VLLVATLGITSLLAYQAVVEVTSHRATAERVLHDYSAFAANRLAYRTSQELIYFGFSPSLQALDKLRATTHTSTLPSPAELVRLRIDLPQAETRRPGWAGRFGAAALGGRYPQ